MKTWQAFSQNQSIKDIFPSRVAVALYLTTAFLFSPTIYPQQNDVPGIVETIEEIIQLERRREERLINASSENQQVISNLRDFKDVRIESQFLRSLIFHSNYDFLKLVSDDQCQFYALIDNLLLNSSAGEIERIPIVYRGEDGESFNALVSRQDFIRHIHRGECFRHREIRELFTPANLQSTLSSIEFPVPQTQDQCRNIHHSWRDNAYLPYLCRIPETQKNIERSQQRLSSTPNDQIVQRRYYRETISRGERFLDQVSDFQRTYLSHLCDNLFDEEAFCSRYLAEDIWTKIVNNEQPAYKMKYQCAQHLGKLAKDINREDLTTCASKFNEGPAICQTLRTQTFPTHFPHPNCRAQSDALNISRLQTEYKDCPGQIDNEGITNIHRILSHISPREIETSAETCAGEATFSFANLLIEYERPEVWPMEICFTNPVTQREDCQPYIPGHHPQSELAETRVVADIITRLMPTPANFDCRMVPKSQYRPNRLEFMSGCHIVYDEKTCSFLHCDKDIYFNDNEITSLTYKGKPQFDYFPVNYTNQRNALSYILEDTYELSNRIIRNLTDLRVFMEQQPSSIIHGIGCIEDIMPQFFKRETFNQCRPTPFIIDGHKDEGPDTLVSIRTAIDDIHMPQLISWNYILNAVSAYSRLHPTRLWALYGIH